jgi:uncharacterized iron-regulated protein
MKYLFITVSLVLASSLSMATPLPQHWNKALVSTQTKEIIPLEALAQQVQPGTVVILGETHDSAEDHKNQKAFLKELSRWSQGRSISIAMEFFDYTTQEIVDQFLYKKIKE